MAFMDYMDLAVQKKAVKLTSLNPASPPPLSL